MSHDKQALITGANRGIGQEVARVLAVKGWKVLIGSRDAKKGEAAATRLKKETRGRVKAIELDVTDPDSIAAAVRKLKDGAVKIDALVNNAGVYGERNVRRTIETNFFGPLRMTQALLPLLAPEARIVNVTSGLGALASLAADRRRQLTDPDLSVDQLADLMNEYVAADGKGWGSSDPYGVSKAALNALTRILARDLAGRAHVNATCPGWVRTDMGGRNAPRSVEEGAASVLFGVNAARSGKVFRDGVEVGPD